MHIHIKRFAFALLVASGILGISQSVFAVQARQCNVQITTIIANGNHTDDARKGHMLVRWVSAGTWTLGGGTPVTLTNCSVVDKVYIDNDQYPGLTGLVLSAQATGQAIDIYVNDGLTVGGVPYKVGDICYAEAIQFAYSSC